MELRRRGIALFPSAIASPTVADQTLIRPATQPVPLSLPLFAHSIPAGFPSPADDYVLTTLDLNEHLVPHKETTFFLRSSGLSMIGAGIYDGDLLVVDRSLTPTHRRIVVAVLDGDFTVKRLYKRGGRIRLLSENPDFAPIEIKDGQELRIWGIVTHTIHQMPP